MKKTVIAFVAIVTLVTVGCKKENENETQAVTKENVAGSYKTTKVMASINGSAEAEITNDDSFTEACKRDDITTFKTDLTFANADAGTKCSPDPSDASGSWKISNNNTIEIETGGDVRTFTVKSLTKKQMVLSLTETDQGLTFVVTSTLTRE